MVARIMRCLAVLALLIATPLFANEPGVEASGAQFRWLDKVSGETGDLDLSAGQSGTVGRLTVLLDDCRFPAEGQPTDAYAHVTIADSLIANPVFSGWMMSSSPALSALDHPRYDVWVMRCLTE